MHQRISSARFLTEWKLGWTLYEGYIYRSELTISENAFDFRRWVEYDRWNGSIVRFVFTVDQLNLKTRDQ